MNLRDGFLLGDCRVRPDLNDLVRGGRTVHLEPKAMEVLLVLAGRPGEVVPKQEILDRAWADTFVGDEVLTNAIWQLRTALEDDSKRPRFIQTVPRRGYRLIAEVRPLETAADQSAAGAAAKRDEPIAAAGPAAGALRARVWLLLTLLAAVSTGSLLVGRFTRPEPLPPPQVLAVAIAPFVNSTGDASLDWTGEGIPDMLADHLSRSPFVTVTLAGGGHSDVEADLLLTGTLIRVGNGLRLLARISEPGAGANPVRIEKIEGKGIQSLIDLVDRLAGRVRIALEVEATGSFDTREQIFHSKTSSVEAYEEFILGRKALDSHENLEAIRHLRRATEHDPCFAHAHDQLANTYQVLGQDDLAAEAIERALDCAHRLTEVERLQILRRQAQVEWDVPSELDYLRRLVLLEPDEPDWHTILGWHYFTHLRACQQSAYELEQALELEPVKRPRIYAVLGDTLVACGEVDRGLAVLERYVELLPARADSHASLGSAYLRVGRYEEARGLFDRALALSDDFSEALVGLGHVERLTGRFGRALERYELARARTVGPDQVAEAELEKAICLLEAGRPGEAGSLAARLLAAGQEVMRARWVRGLALVAAGDQAAAGAVLEEMAERIESTGSLYQSELHHHLAGKRSLALGDAPEAVRQFERALELAPEDRAFFLHALAEAQLGAADRAGALDTLELALEVNSNHAPSLQLRGEVLEALGRPGEAAASYRRLLELWSSADEGARLAALAASRLSALERGRPG